MGHAFTARRAFTFIELLVVISIISLLIAAFWLSADAAPPPATEKAPAYYVAVDGKPGNSGTHESPWDILSALGGKQVVAPGATIYLRGGTYRKDRGPNPGDFHEKDDEKTVVADFRAPVDLGYMTLNRKRFEVLGFRLKAGHENPTVAPLFLEDFLIEALILFFLLVFSHFGSRGESDSFPVGAQTVGRNPSFVGENLLSFSPIHGDSVE